jgi:hypothetical protein
MPSTQPEGYVENPDFVPNPTDAVGTLDTSGTAGSAHSKIEEITPIFDVARQQDLATAAKALDDKDDSVDAALVTLPTGASIVNEDPEAAKKRVAAAARRQKDVDLTSSRQTASTKAAAEGGSPSVETSVQGEGGTDGGGTGSTGDGKQGTSTTQVKDGKSTTK